MLRIGLTGGVASGKTTVADMFAALGVPIIDTDLIARDVVRPGTPALEEIRAAFGDAVIGDDGGLDRAAMRRIVFSDDHERRRLEAIVHPRIRDAALQESARADGPYQIIAVPLLVGSPMRQLMDRILVVDCDEATQTRRLMARDGEDEAGARRILAAQASRDERLSIADDVIENQGDLEATREQVEELHRRYMAAAD